jgi:microcystin-dependent protein
MSYVKTVWVDNQAPAIDAVNLNHIEEGIASNDTLLTDIISGAVKVGYAAKADTIASGSVGGGTSSGAPIGSIIMWGSATPPADYIECNGQTLPRTHALFSVLGTVWGIGDGVTTFNIPDMRGFAPRAWDHGRGVDGGRSLGSMQDDALQGHTFGTGSEKLGYINVDATQGTHKYAGFGTSFTGAVTMVTDGTSGAPKQSYETRMKNIALMFVIKAA